MANISPGTIVASCGYNGGWTAYGQAQVYAGYAASTKFAAVVQLMTPQFAGKSISMTISLMGNTFRPAGGSPTLRWALCSSDENKSSYVNPGAVTNDPYQMASGTITFTKENTLHDITIEMDSLEGSTYYYLVLWGYQTGTVGRITLAAPSDLGVSVTYLQDQNITSVDDAVMGSSCNVSWTPIDDSFYYKLEFSMGGWSDSTEVIHPGVTTAYVYTGYVIPLEAAYQIPNDTEGAMSATLRTYADRDCTDFVSEDTKTFSVTVPNNAETQPVVGMELSLVSDLPSSFDGLFIQNLTKVGADITANGQYGASIDTLQMVMGGSVYGDPFVSGLITQTGDVTVTAKATDSRGFIGKAERTIYVIPYAKPALIPADGETGIVCVRCDEDGNITDSGTYLKLKAKRSYSPVETDGVQHNFCRIQYRCNGGSWDTILDENAITDEVDTIIGGVVISTTSAYTIEVCAVDDIGNKSSAVIIVPSDSVEFHLREGGDGAAFGEYAQNAKVLSVAESWELRVKGTMTVGGKTLLDMFYPVGSVYMSVNSTNPATFLGGNWELISSADYYIWKRV